MGKITSNILMMRVLAESRMINGKIKILNRNQKSAVTAEMGKTTFTIVKSANIKRH
jgi:hypothetical protein